jgi:hypothetical protein
MKAHPWRQILVAGNLSVVRPLLIVVSLGGGFDHVLMAHLEALGLHQEVAPDQIHSADHLAPLSKAPPVSEVLADLATTTCGQQIQVKGDLSPQQLAGRTAPLQHPGHNYLKTNSACQRLPPSCPVADMEMREMVQRHHLSRKVSIRCSHILRLSMRHPRLRFHILLTTLFDLAKRTHQLPRFPKFPALKPIFQLSIPLPLSITNHLLLI